MTQEEFEKLRVGDRVFFSSEWFKQHQSEALSRLTFWGKEIIDTIVTISTIIDISSSINIEEKELITLTRTWIFLPPGPGETTGSPRGQQQQQDNNSFCSCSSPDLIKNNTGIGGGSGSSFSFCRNCRKEKR